MHEPLQCLYDRAPKAACYLLTSLNVSLALFAPHHGSTSAGLGANGWRTLGCATCRVAVGRQQGVACVGSARTHAQHATGLGAVGMANFGDGQSNVCGEADLQPRWLLVRVTAVDQRCIFGNQVLVRAHATLVASAQQVCVHEPTIRATGPRVGATYACAYCHCVFMHLHTHFAGLTGQQSSAAACVGPLLQLEAHCGHTCHHTNFHRLLGRHQRP